jgi:hypothetical protein
MTQDFRHRSRRIYSRKLTLTMQLQNASNAIVITSTGLCFTKDHEAKKLTSFVT